MSNVRAIGKVLLYILFNLIVAVVILEGVFFVLLHTPRVTGAAPAPVRRLVQQVYRHFNRALIQFDPKCAQYDAEETYTLRPGACTFGNIEFTNTFRINRLGLRDENAALDAPEVIVLGDSHAMGWGVEQDETFGRVLANEAGLKVLNAAVSSYGTVREMKMLDRLDTSRLRVLVVQYADNDLPENRTFREHDNHLPISSEAEYQNIVRYYESQRSYYPGKYVFRLVMKVLRLEQPEPDQLKMESVPPADEVGLFLNALEHASRTPLDTVQVVVLEVSQEFDHPRTFIAALADPNLRDGHPPFVRRLITLDTTSVLKSTDFYILDDHMNAHGHRVVGEALARLVRQVVH